MILQEYMRQYLQNQKLKWLGHLERMEENTWFSKCRTFKVNGNFPRESLIA